jgi:hypothetical protein
MFLLIDQKISLTNANLTYNENNVEANCVKRDCTDGLQKAGKGRARGVRHLTAMSHMI